jgi:hypothetical protein
MNISSPGNIIYSLGLEVEYHLPYYLLRITSTDVIRVLNTAYMLTRNSYNIFIL